MIGKVYTPLIGGLLLAAMGALNVLSHGLDWWGGFCLGSGAAALALAFVYWRGSRAQRS